MSVIFDDYRAVIRFGDRLVGGIMSNPADEQAAEGRRVGGSGDGSATVPPG